MFMFGGTLEGVREEEEEREGGREPGLTVVLWEEGLLHLTGHLDLDAVRSNWDAGHFR